MTPGDTVIDPLDRIATDPVALIGVSDSGTISGVDALCAFAGVGEETAAVVEGSAFDVGWLIDDGWLVVTGRFP